MATRRKARKKRKSKRPADVNQLTHFLGEQSTAEQRSVVQQKTAEIPVDPTRAEISRVMAALGRKGGLVGGRKRAESLTKAQRVEIALKAARARWDAPQVKTDNQ